MGLRDNLLVYTLHCNWTNVLSLHAPAEKRQYGIRIAGLFTNEKSTDSFNGHSFGTQCGSLDDTLELLLMLGVLRFCALCFVVEMTP